MRTSIKEFIFMEFLKIDHLTVKIKIMKSILTITFFIIALLSFSQEDFNTLMMKSTYKLSGESFTKNKNVYGTCFIVAEPVPNDKDSFYPVLITAKHVFDDMKGDSITIYARLKEKDIYITFPYKIRIRDGNNDLYASHPTQDVAAIPIMIPDSIDIQLIPTKFLADDSTLIKNDVTPGVKINCLGFPLVQNSNSADFPILRSGYIASYPIVPTDKYPTFLYDVTVFKGNSGGPVYYAYINEIFSKGKYITADKWVMKEKFYILGLISAERISEKKLESYYESFTIDTQLYIAVVVHSRYIKETIKLLGLN